MWNKLQEPSRHMMELHTHTYIYYTYYTLCIYIICIQYTPIYSIVSLSAYYTYGSSYVHTFQSQEQYFTEVSGEKKSQLWAADPNTIQEMYVYAIKGSWWKETTWTRTSSSKWLKHSIHSQHLQDGNSTELTTAKLKPTLARFNILKPQFYPKSYFKHPRL